MSEYRVEIVQTSKELSLKQKVALKNTNAFLRIDKLLNTEERILINPDFWAELHIYNDRSADKEYTSYVVADKNGDYYLTGSDSFMNTFKAIFEELSGTDEEWAIAAFRIPSRNREGKYLISCGVV